MIDSFSYAVTLFFASYINLLGNTLLQIYGRHFQRIIGTTLGLVTATLLMLVPMSIEVKISLVVIIYVIVEYFMPRNYSIGIFFVTNMLMLQMTLTTPAIWPSLIHSRFYAILVGSLIGAASAFVQYKLFDFYSQTLINEKTYDAKEFK